MLFRHSTEMATQQNQNMRGGKGTVTVKHVLNPDELFGNGRLFAQLTVPPGASVGLHKHEGEAETYLILQGQGRYHNNDESYDIAAGDMARVDDGDSHGIENTGDTPLVLIGLILFSHCKAN